MAIFCLHSLLQPRKCVLQYTAIYTVHQKGLSSRKGFWSDPILNTKRAADKIKRPRPHALVPCGDSLTHFSPAILVRVARGNLHSNESRPTQHLFHARLFPLYNRIVESPDQLCAGAPQQFSSFHQLAGGVVLDLI